MQLAISEAEIRELLTAIERGTVHLTPMQEPQRIYSGIVEQFSNVRIAKISSKVVRVSNRLARYNP